MADDSVVHAVLLSPCGSPAAELRFELTARGAQRRPAPRVSSACGRRGAGPRPLFASLGSILGWGRGRRRAGRRQVLTDPTRHVRVPAGLARACAAWPVAPLLLAERGLHSPLLSFV
jgi:hypothetical protein